MYRKLYKRYTEDFFVLLDKNRRRWRYKVNESININYNNKINIFRRVGNKSELYVQLRFRQNESVMK